MCTDCGCGTDEVTINGKKVRMEHSHDELHQHSHVHPHSHSHSHRHDGHEHIHPHNHQHEHMHASHEHFHGQLHDMGQAHDDHSHNHTDEHTHSHESPNLGTARTIKLEQDILAKNNHFANENRKWNQAHGVFSLNFVSSPGSGKTSLLVKTIEQIKKDVSVVVIEGDQQTDNDAQRIRETGVSAIQINTGKGCHLDANMVLLAREELKIADNTLLLIENVGNLVCPAAFDLGENHKVVILSVTEGEDKPLKYPDMFRAADLMLLNKSDLLPHLDFDINLAMVNAKKINPKIQIIKISAKSGEGIDEWLSWLKIGIAASKI